MRGFLRVYLISCILMVIFISPLIADDEPDLWDLTPEEDTEPPLKESPLKEEGHKKKKLKIRGRVVLRGGEEKSAKTTILGDSPKDSFSVLQLGHENSAEGFIYKMKSSTLKMAICVALDKFVCKSEDISSSLKISVFRYGSDDDVLSTVDWDCDSGNNEQGKTYSTGGYGILVELTGNWDENSKATLSIQSYYQTTNQCPAHLPFDCDACKISFTDGDLQQCASQGHLKSLMCHKSKRSNIHGRSVNENKNKTGVQDPASKPTEDSADLTVPIIIVVEFLLKGSIFGACFMLMKRSNQVHPPIPA